MPNSLPLRRSWRGGAASPRRRPAACRGCRRRSRTTRRHVLAQHDGANGRNDSRYLTLRLSTFCIVGERGRRGSSGRPARADRTPCGPGTSPRPCHRPARRRGRRWPSSSAAPRTSRRRPSGAPRCRPARRRAQVGALHRVARRHTCAAGPSAGGSPTSAAPSAPPASPAAGWIQMFSNVPSRSTLPLATQLSATPPARHRFFCRSPCAGPGQPQHDLLGDGLDRGRQVHVALGQQFARPCAAGRRTTRRTSRWSWSGRCNSRSSRGRGGRSRRPSRRSGVADLCST
jgi:hypothetical protein